MTSKQFVRYVAKKNGWTLPTARVAIASIFDSLYSALTDGESVKILNFGTFDVVTRKPKAIGKPDTHERYIIPERKYVRFLPNTYLRHDVRRLINVPDNADEIDDFEFDDSDEID